MAAENKRRPNGFDFHVALVAHIDANSNANAWAKQCLAYRAEGNAAKARAAENKAKFWSRKALALEARATRGKPTGGRSLEK
jgi:hypothetical protein